MDFKEYAKVLGADEIINDLTIHLESAEGKQKEALESMITVYSSALNGETNIEPLKKILNLTVSGATDSNTKLDNVIRKHAVISILLLVELSNQDSNKLREWLKTIEISTKTTQGNKEYEEKTTIHIQEPELKKQIEFETNEDEISLFNRIQAKKWLDNHAPNNPKWSGYQNSRSLMDQLLKPGVLDTEKKLQTLTNTTEIRSKMKMLNTFIAKRFGEVINGYREAAGLKPIVRLSTQLGADEVSFYSLLEENNQVAQVASTGRDLKVDYFADSLFYQLAKNDNELLEKKQSFMLTIFITECRHIIKENMDRYILTYHYELNSK